MKHLILSLLILLAVAPAQAQKKDKRAKAPKEVKLEDTSYRIIFQLTTADTLAHKALMKQIGNMTSVAPATQIEVVCHGPGLTLLQQSKSKVSDKIKEYASKGVVFSACEFSMKERNVAREDILPQAGFVRAGILHIVMRQDQGWYYIKSGF